MKNYKEYFPESNACNLEESFSLEERLKVLEQAKQAAQRNIKVGSFNCYLTSLTGYIEDNSAVPN